MKNPKRPAARRRTGDPRTVFVHRFDHAGLHPKHPNMVKVGLFVESSDKASLEAAIMHLGTFAAMSSEKKKG